MREQDAHLALAADALKAAKLALDAGLPRDSVSRSYHAVYHAAHALLASVGEDTRTHKGLLYRTRERFGPQLGGASLQVLARLQRLRESSDYEVGFALTLEEANHAWQAANEFVERARSLLS